MEALILMTRIPIPGKTKTRLMDVFTGERCADIHKCFLLDLFNVFKSINHRVDIYLTYTPEDSFHIIEGMIPDYIKAFPQQGQELGERMANAMEYVFESNYSKVVLMGADIPETQPEDIIESLKLLNENDIVLNPTYDGGYYLVGMNGLHREIFNKNLKWGKKSVLEGTIDIANSINLRVGLGPKHRDIDTKEDLISFKDRIDKGHLSGKIIPQNTIAYLEKCWGEVYYAER